MRTMAAIVIALSMGCTPLCKETRKQTVYHQECKEQTIHMGAITKPVCFTRYEVTEISTSSPAKQEE